MPAKIPQNTKKMNDNQAKKRKYPEKHERKQQKFLELYLEMGDVAAAYYAAGYTPRSREAAISAGNRLLRKLDEQTDYREIFRQIGLTNRHIGRRMKELLDSSDEQVAARTLAIATKCVGWQRETIGLDEGVEIVIMARKRASGLDESDQADDAKPSTPAIPMAQGISK